MNRRRPTHSFPFEAASPGRSCPPLPLTYWEFERAYTVFRNGGATEQGRRKREGLADALKPHLRDLHGRVSLGEHEWSTPVLRYVGARPIAVVGAEDAVVLGACNGRLRRNPRLPQLLPHAYAYVPGRGAQTAARAFLRSVEEVAHEHGEAVSVSFDLERAFRSLDPFRALERLETWGCSQAIVEALRRFYTLMQDVGFVGIHEGPSTSPLLADVALAPLDVMLAKMAEKTGRYSDNIFVVFRPEDQDAKARVEREIERFGREEGVILAAHKWEIRRFGRESGFAEPTLWLSHVFSGRECRPGPGKLKRARARVLELVRRGKVESVQDLIAGIAAFYVPLVPESVLESLAQELRAEARAEIQRLPHSQSNNKEVFKQTVVKSSDYNSIAVSHIGNGDY